MDCMSADTLSPFYKEERESYWDAREAIAAAIALKLAWPKAEYISFLSSDDSHTNEELAAMAQVEYDKALKCEVCGDLMQHETYQLDDCIICSDACAEKLARMVDEQVL